MKDYALELAASKADSNAKVNAMREYLQAYVLRICHDQGLLKYCAFVGGTALRFLYELPRFSEDLDFSLVDRARYSFDDLIAKIKRELQLAGYDVAIAYNDRQAVHKAMIKFEGLLFEAGLSPHRDQKFSVKLEVDTNPPQGARLTTALVNKFFPVTFVSYDIASMFAGKLNALFSRRYTKGRDFFDLGWYLSRWRELAPNIPLLENGLKQAGWRGKIPSIADWREQVHEVTQKADWKDVVRDVKNFLDRPADIDVFTKDNVLHLVRPPS